MNTKGNNDENRVHVNINLQKEDMNFNFLFDNLPSKILILDSGLRVIAATNEHLQSTGRKREETVGRNIFDIFSPERNEEDLSYRRMRDTFNHVLNNLETHVMDVLKFDITSENGDPVERYWSTSNAPILDEYGKLRYIVNKVEDITDYVVTKKREKEQEEIVLKQARELVQINKMLVTEYAKAVEVSRSKSFLISNVSHEMRTPLTSIIGFNELLSISTGLSPDQSELVKMTDESAKALLLIVNNILELSKMEAGEMKLMSDHVNLPLCIKDILSIFATKAREKGLLFDLVLEIPDKYCVLTDERKLGRFLTNLVDNAIKFTEKGSVKVLVTFARDDKDEISTVFKIIDTGVGISMEKIDTLFKPFSQVDQTDTRRYGGVGLGLTIVKSIITLMKGRIKVDSVVGGGTIFTVFLNFTKCEETDVPKKEASGSFRNLSGLQNKNILVVDDDRIIQQLLKKIFNKLNVNYASAFDGAVAVELFKNNKFDAVLMDIQMPVMDGYESTKLMREHEVKTKATRIPIIAMSASVMVSDKIKSFKFGMDDFISKPFTMKQFVDLMQNYMW